MGNDFEFRIGMTTQQVISSISRTNATDKTKQMIINFCNNDQDKKISNEIELAMLNSWASGSEKVKMPTADRMNKVNISQVSARAVGVNDDGTHYKYYRTNNKNRFLGISSDNSIVHTTIDIYNHNSKTNKCTNVMDTLTDNNSDGYADIRSTHYSNSNNEDEDEETFFETNYIDNNLDGLYDVKHTSTNTMKRYEQITTKTTTDLATGHTKTETKIHNFKTGKDSLTVEE